MALDRDKMFLALSNIFRFFYVIASATVLQLYLGSLGANSFQISLLEASAWAGILLFAPIWGAISDMTKRRKGIMMLSILLSAAIIPFFGYVSSITLILFLRFLLTVIDSGFPPIALAITSQYGGTSERGRNMAVFNSSKSTGFALARILSGLFLTYLSFTETFWYIGASGLLALVFASLIEKRESTDTRIEIKKVWNSIKNRLIPSGSLLQKKGLIFLYLGIFLRKAGIIGTFSLIIYYMVSVQGISEGVMGVVVALNPVVQIVFMLIFGRTVDAVGRKKVFSLGFLATVPVPIIFAFSTTPLAFSTGFILLGVAFSAITAGSTAFIGDVSPEHREAELLGYRKTAQGFAGILGPVISGLTSLYLGFAGMFYAMSGLMFIGFISAYLGTSETFI
ncbi:MAG: MFS transporter [Candidatus Nanohaloarchaea archaeon]|nr:MFS transporter [Candidatus Nanohaloarchaea archaeon]